MANPLTFGNPLKFGPDSCPKTKGRPTFLHREREHPKLHVNNTITPRAALQRGPMHAGAVAMAGGRMRARDNGDGFSVSAPIEAKRRNVKRCKATKKAKRMA